MDLEKRVEELENTLEGMREWAKKVQYFMDTAPKKAAKGTTWTFEEVEFLKSHYTQYGPSLSEVWEEHFPDNSRTEKSISSKASKLGVKYGLSIQDKRFISNILKGSGIIHKKKAIELAEELGVNLLKLVEYLQANKVGSDEEGSYGTDLKEQWGL